MSMIFHRIYDLRVGRFILQAVLIFIVVFLSVKAGLWLAFPPYYTSPVWFGFGVAAGTALLFGIRYWFSIVSAIFLGFFLHNYSSVELFLSPLNIALSVSIVGTILVMAKYFLIKFLVPEEQFLRKPVAVFKFLCITLALSVITYLLLSLFVRITGSLPPELSRPVIIAWTGSDLIGSLLFIPFVLSFSKKYSQIKRSSGQLEYLLMLTAIFSVALILYFLQDLYSEKLVYVIMPFMFWIAFRFSIRATTTGLGLIAMLSTYLTAQSIAKTTGDGFFHAIYFFQLYLLLVAFLSFLINAHKKEFNVEESPDSSRERLRKRISDNIIVRGMSNLFNQTDILRLAVEHSPETVLVTDPEGVILFVNPAFTRITGYSTKDVIGKKPSLLKSGYHSGSYYEELWHTIKSGETWKGEFYNRKKDGSYYWEEATIAPVFDKSNITHFVCIKEDITIRKTTSDALKQSEEQFRTLAENSPVIIIKINTESTIEYVNHYIEGVDKSEILNKLFYEILEDKYHRIARENLALTFKGKISTSFEITVRNGSAGLQFFNVVIAPVLDKGQVNAAIIILQDITEIVSSREEIREKEKKYRLLAENAADIIWVMDNQLTYTFISPSFENITGYNIEQIEEMKSTSCLPQLPPEYVSKLNRLRGDKQGTIPSSLKNKWETEIRRKDGQMIWLESKIKPVFSSRNEFEGLIGVSRDITIKKQSEIALRESEEKLRTFFENTNAIILMIDSKTGQIVEANNAALYFYGYTESEIRDIDFYDIARESVEKTLNKFQNLQAGKQVMIRMQHTLKNGRIREVEVSPTFVKTENRNLLFTIVQDITRRKKAIDALKESESKKLALLKIIPDLILVINRKGLILDLYADNPSKLYIPPDKLIGMRFKDILPQKIKEKFKQSILKAFKTHEIITFDYSYRKGGEVVFEEARLIVSGEDELLIILRDISELKRGEQELKRAWEEAERANMAKSTFLASMSHEIRTPINAIMGFNELLIREIQAPHLVGYLSSIKFSSKTLLSLIDDILDLSKIEAGEFSIKPEMTNLISILEEIKNVFNFKMKQKGLLFEINTPVAFPKLLLIDELRIRQIMLNLVGNAYKFTDKGSISVNCRIMKKMVRKRDTYVDLGIEVSDTGIGIPAEHQKRIFEAFKQQDQQDSRKYGGTGLGLAITKSLVEIMDGTITVASTIGKGSTFKVYIPNILIGSRMQTEPVRIKQTRKVLFKNSTVLIADDVTSNRELLKGIITGNNINFYEAVDGKQTMKLAEEKRPDVLLLDINMPKANGFEVAEYLKNHNELRKIPIIAISATGISLKEQKNAKYFDVFLVKPFSIKELTQYLKNYLSFDEIDTEKTVTKKFINLTNNISIKDKSIIKSTVEKLLADYQTIRESSSFEEIRDFAIRIQELSSIYHVPELRQSADKVIEASENYDIERITECITDLYQLLNQIVIGIK